jgi:hypothetical protein
MWPYWWQSYTGDFEFKVIDLRGHTLNCDICGEPIRVGDNAIVEHDYETEDYIHPECVMKYMPCPTCNGRGYIYPYDDATPAMILFGMGIRATNACPQCNRKRVILRNTIQGSLITEREICS